MEQILFVFIVVNKISDMFKYVAIGLAFIAGGNTLGLKHEADSTLTFIQPLTPKVWMMLKRQPMHSSDLKFPISVVQLWPADNRMENISNTNTLVKMPPSLWPKSQPTESTKPTTSLNSSIPSKVFQAPFKEVGSLQLLNPMLLKASKKLWKILTGIDCI